MYEDHDKPSPTVTVGGNVASDIDITSKPSTTEAVQADTKVETTSQQVSTTDVTKAFVVAASALHTGQLVKDEFFTLFEAVGALEIMDSKMDSGHLELGEALEDEYDVLRELQPDEVLGIMDQTLCHEVAWHEGHSLSQTLFTSIYIERLLWPEPRNLEQAQFSRRCDEDIRSKDPLLHLVLRSYCIAVAKACHLVHSLVTSESYYEVTRKCKDVVVTNVVTADQEEDFNSQLYHRELLPKVSTEEIYLLLDGALDYMSASNTPRSIQSAIQSRLLFRQALLKALEEDLGPLRARSKCSLSCIPLLQDIKSTAKLGTPVSDCFSTRIQRSLVSSVPPRPMVTTSLSDTLTYLEILCRDAAGVDEIMKIESGEDLSTAISVFMTRRPQPSVYIRALVQSFMAQRETGRVLGDQTPKQFLFSNLEALVLPESRILHASNELLEAPTTPGFQSTSILVQFDEKAGQHYLNGFRISCLNRCRTRRSLCHFVADLDVLQADAEELDGALRIHTGENSVAYGSDQRTFAYPLSSWVYHHKLIHIRQVIQIGFELAIYAPDELAGMYWYLSYICGTHISHLDRVSFFLKHDLQIRDTVARRASLEGGTEFRHQAAFARTLENLSRIQALLKATDALSRALHALYALLLRHEITGIPPRPYSSDQLRYELRMKSFLCLNLPEPVDFDSFRAETCFAGLDDGAVLAECSLQATEARKLWDQVLKAGWSIRQEAVEIASATTIKNMWTAGVKNVIRACIATRLCARELESELENSGSLKNIRAVIPLPGGNDCWHEWWIVPRVSDLSQGGH